ncbi:MAG: hypothetical protein ACI83O_000805 [Patescibacteria group bacterium]|jgi:hypothetical protein
MSNKKKYFKERTVTELKKLEQVPVESKHIVEQIMNLEKDQCLKIPSQVSQSFYSGTPDQNARKQFKHGDYMILPQPKTKEAALESPLIPLQLRNQAFGQLEDRLEFGLHNVGYSFRPVQGANKTKRVVPFVYLAQGAKLFSYAAQHAGGIGLELYSEAKRARTHGATVVAAVPSRTQKQQRYSFTLQHVPIHRGQHNLASVLSLEPKVHQTQTPSRTKHDQYNIRFTKDDGEDSNITNFTPQDVAAYLAIINQEWNNNQNMTPLEMNPFAIPSRQQAEFYKRLTNNLLVETPQPKGKPIIRKPYQVEQSVLLGRAIAHYGAMEFAFIDAARDGNLAEYDGWNWGE